MPVRKKVNYKTKKKNAVVPRTDANQGIREHNERVRKEREYYAKKLAEYQAKQELARQQAQSTASQTIDGMQSE